MTHSKSWRRISQEMRAEAAAREERERPARLRSEREAKLAVAAWNVRVVRGGPLWFYPTIGAALAAGRPFLTCVCPACRQTGCIDLRRVDRHPAASLQSLIPALSCRRCCPHPPFARLTGLWRQPR
jgi:hypothetical protein